MNTKLKFHQTSSVQEVVTTDHGYTYSRGFLPLHIGKYKVSIQASSSAYSEPRVDLPYLASYEKVEMIIIDTSIPTDTEETQYDDFVRPWIKWGHRDEKGNAVYDDKRLDIGWEGDWQKDPEDPEARTTTAAYITWEQASDIIDFLEEKVDAEEFITRNLKHSPEMLEVAYGITKDNIPKF